MRPPFRFYLRWGPDRLTTTRVAERAGVSVGTLYQYFPNKRSLLLSALEKHQDQVVGAVELACRRNHGQQLSTMIESVVEAFVDAKMKRSDISVPLYATAAGAQERALVNKAGKRARAAMTSYAGNRPEYQIRRPAVHKSYAAFGDGGRNASRSRSRVLAGMVRLLRKQLVLLCRGFLIQVLP